MSPPTPEHQRFRDLVSKLNALSLKQSLDWDEAIPEDIWNEYFNHHRVKDTDLLISRSKWDEIHADVVEIRVNTGHLLEPNWQSFFLGIFYDIAFRDNDTYSFHEMKTVTVTTYEKL